MTGPLDPADFRDILADGFTRWDRERYTPAAAQRARQANPSRTVVAYAGHGWFAVFTRPTQNHGNNNITDHTHARQAGS